MLKSAGRLPTKEKEERVTKEPRLLGKGSYGRVHKVDGAAVKVIDMPASYVHERGAYTALRGVPHVASLDGPRCSFARRQLVMEAYMVSLHDFLKTIQQSRLRTKVTELKYQFAADVARALHHMHVRGLLHADMTARNVLIARRRTVGSKNEKDGDTFRAYVADLGVLAPIGHAKVHYTPLPFREPRCVPDTKHDIYCLGVIGFEMFADTVLPPDFSSYGEMLDRVRKKVAPGRVQRFLLRMLSENREERPSANRTYLFFARLLEESRNQTKRATLSSSEPSAHHKPTPEDEPAPPVQSSSSPTVSEEFVQRIKSAVRHQQAACGIADVWRAQIKGAIRPLAQLVAMRCVTKSTEETEASVQVYAIALCYVVASIYKPAQMRQSRALELCARLLGSRTVAISRFRVAVQRLVESYPVMAAVFLIEKKEPTTSS